MNNEPKTLTLKFNISGAFVTETARDWLFNQGKPYAVVEEFLLSCMSGTSIPEAELKRKAQDVLLGRAEFVGNTADDTYAYVTIDEFDSFGANTVFKKLNDLQTKLNKKEQELDETTQRYFDLYDNAQHLVDNEFEMEEVKFDGNKSLLEDLASATGNSGSYGPSPISTGSPILDSYFKASRTEDNYGFVKPNGKFILVEWCDHAEYAIQAIEDNGWKEEFLTWRKGNPDGSECDFLSYHKGWVLLHNPSRGVAMLERDFIKNTTKAQKEFLFDYYIERNEPEMANGVWA